MAKDHRGPLQVQKALYPEGDDLAHTILIHPPGGIAGGDALSIEVKCEPGAQALITTPGAAKWYKANGRQATQDIRIEVGGALEWLPQEAIVFDAAEVESSITIELAADAAMLGWDIVALGRRAAGESFEHGRFAQTIRLAAGGELLWLERTRIRGGDPLLASPVGLAGHSVFGCLWAYGPTWSDERMENVRNALPPMNATALTRLTPRLLVARALAPSTQALRGALLPVWEILRPVVRARAPRAPRIWST